MCFRVALLEEETIYGIAQSAHSISCAHIYCAELVWDLTCLLLESLSFFLLKVRQTNPSSHLLVIFLREVMTLDGSLFAAAACFLGMLYVDERFLLIDSATNEWFLPSIFLSHEYPFADSTSDHSCTIQPHFSLLYTTSYTWT